MKKKNSFIRSVLLGLVFLMTGSLIFAGGQNEVEAAPAELPTVVWKFSHTQAPEHLMNQTALKLSEYVAEKTGGKFEIQIFPSGTLGWEREVLESMQLGTMAMTWAANGPFAQFVPSYNVFSIPGLFNSEEAIEKVVTDDALMAPLREEAESKGLIEVGIGNYFFRDTYTKSKPVNIPEDLEGTAIRVMGVPILVDTYKALGANVTTTAWAELYSALQLGVVDGIDHVPSAVASMKFYENLNYCAEIPIFATPMLIVASKPKFDKLPAEYQAILLEAADYAMADYNAKSSADRDEKLAYLADQGMIIHTPDPSPFFEKVQSVRKKYLAELPGWVTDLADDISNMK